jgi:hypothetical protein
MSNSDNDNEIIIEERKTLDNNLGRSNRKSRPRSINYSSDNDSQSKQSSVKNETERNR